MKLMTIYSSILLAFISSTGTAVVLIGGGGGPRGTSVENKSLNQASTESDATPYFCREGDEFLRTVNDNSRKSSSQEIFTCIDGRMVQKYAPVDSYVPYTGPECTHDEVRTVNDNSASSHSRMIYFYCIDGKLEESN